MYKQINNINTFVNKEGITQEKCSDLNPKPNKTNIFCKKLSGDDTKQKL
jgi:hypothetical protein